jgi:Xaa-Pro aminopeptidase
MELTNFKARRDQVLEQMKDGVAFYPAHSIVQKSNDTEFPFRQNSHFKYLTGFNEADAILVLCNNHDKYKSILFVLPKDETSELWTGKRTGVDKALETLNVDATFSIDEFEEKLPELLINHKRAYIDIFENDDFFLKIKKASRKMALAKKRKAHSPQEFLNGNALVEKLRLIKDQNEILNMKKAIAITSKAHQASMALASEGKNESDLLAVIEYISKIEGASGMAYDSIVAGGENACTLHYIENNSPLKNGEMVLIDAGCDVALYASDISRTFPVSGEFTSKQKELYQLVLDAQKYSISLCSPGKTLGDIHNASVRVLTQGLIDMGLLTGDVDKNIEERTFHKYYPHGTSHWLGLDVHDQSPYLDEELNEVILAPGMVFTIEPGLYFQKGDSATPLELQGIGIRIEDNILITETGHENLSAMIPKEISEIEAACKKSISEFI